LEVKNYLPEYQYSQLELWRIVIGFTKELSKFPHPFRNAGYSFHRIEPLIENLTPDLVSSRKGFWLISDLTLDPTKDLSSFDKYGALGPSILADIQSPHYHKDLGKPSILLIGSEESVTSQKCKNSKCAGLIVFPKILFYGHVNFFDEILANEFIKIKSIESEPPTSFLAVPETDGAELKRAIASVLVTRLPKINEKPNEFFTTDIVDGLLNHEVGLFSDYSKKKLAGKVKSNLFDFKNDIGKNFITYNQRRDSFRYKELKSYNKIISAIKTWAGLGHIQETVDIYTE